MQEEDILNSQAAGAADAQPSDTEKKPAKRGRKPKVRNPEDGAPAEDFAAASDSQESAPRRRGRPPRSERPQDSQNVSAQLESAQKAPSQPRDYEHPFKNGGAEPEAKQYVKPSQEDDSYAGVTYDPISKSDDVGDDFAYSRSSYDDDDDARGEGGDDAEVPQRFTTDDADLVHDNYSADSASREEVPAVEGAAKDEEPRDAAGNSQNQPQAERNQGHYQNKYQNRHQQNYQNGQSNQNRQNQPNRQNSKWRDNRDNRGNQNYQGGNQNYQGGSQNYQGGNQGYQSGGQNKFQPRGGQNYQNGQSNQNRQNQPGRQNNNLNVQNGLQNRQQKLKRPKWMQGASEAPDVMNPSDLPEWDVLKDVNLLKAYIEEHFNAGEVIEFAPAYALNVKELAESLAKEGAEPLKTQNKSDLVAEFFKAAREKRALVKVSGVLDVFEDGFGGAVCYEADSYRLKRACAYVSQKMIDDNGLQRGHTLSVLACSPRADGKENCPIALTLESVMDKSVDDVRALTPFTELTPYYPTRRMIMEVDEPKSPESFSMRVVDLLTPMGLGQRALIVAPPRTGKTVLMQGMAKSIRKNTPEAHLIILLVDERPEEVTDFRRTVDAEIVSSTFDEEASSHVHAAEMVISRARRMVEDGRHVIILLDSITRLARAYNALMPNSGKILSGGVEAGALQKPKRFFGSARNIENGGSLTIIGTALVETGSKMDEVIFEEFKGTGNLELHLDRSLVDKRIFPAINLEKSGTRKEELLYHPDEMAKIYSLRRAMKGVPSTEAMEMLIMRLKKVKTNVEFLMSLNR